MRHNGCANEGRSIEALYLKETHMQNEARHPEGVKWVSCYKLAANVRTNLDVMSQGVMPHFTLGTILVRYWVRRSIQDVVCD